MKKPIFRQVETPKAVGNKHLKVCHNMEAPMTHGTNRTPKAADLNQYFCFPLGTYFVVCFVPQAYARQA